MREALGVEVPLRALFERPTAAAFGESVRDLLRSPRGAAPRAIERADRHERMPLSFAQQRLWFLEQLEPASAFYTLSVHVHSTDTVDVRALGEAFEALLARHEVLRTAFDSDLGAPRQEILEHAAVAIPVVDCSALSRSQFDAEAERIARLEAQRPFDLAHAPLLRATLLRYIAGDRLLLSMHHVVSDGWSMGILVDELIRAYDRARFAATPSLPELAVQYADYAVWQRAWLEGGELERQLSYWSGQLEGVEPLELPTDRPRPAVQTYRGSSVRFRLDEELTRELKALSRREGVTLFMTLLAGLQALLSRYTGQQDIAVGSPVAGRTRQELEGLIGFFVNTLVLRTDLSGEPSFRELLARVREVALSAYAHQDVPFERLVEELSPVRNLSRSPLFQAMLVLQNAPRQHHDMAARGLTVDGLGVENRSSKFDVLLSLVDDAGALRGQLEYNTDLFDRETAEQMARHFEALLEAAVADPSLPVARLPILSDAERAQILHSWNDTQVQADVPRCVHELFERQARLTPDAIALEHGALRLSYAELNARANRLARHLRSLGVGSDAPVALLLERSAEAAVAILATLKASGAYLPLDPAYPPHRLALMLDDSAARVLLTHSRLLPSLPDHAPCVVCLDLLEPTLAATSAHDLRLPTSPDQLAYLIYTSGSTGTPKGVCLPHGALSNLLEWNRAEFASAHRVLQFASLSFDASFNEMFTAWSRGGACLVVPEEVRADGEGLAQFLHDARIDNAILPVVMLQQVAEAVSGREWLLAGVRELTTTGEQMQLTREVKRLLGRLEGCRLHNHYGPSETHVVTAEGMEGEAERWPMHPPIGRPIANTQVWVLDAEFEPVAVGVIGEVYIGGANLARGYWRGPGLTAEKFVASPHAAQAGARMYRTGDLGRYLRDGRIEYAGRADAQVKVRGYRVELGEVEAALGEQEGVREVVVEAEGEGSTRQLAAYVVVGEGVSIAEVREQVRRLLPDYMVPTRWVRLERMPLTANGKVDRRALSRYEAEGGGDARAQSHVMTAAEELVAGIWCEVLGREGIGPQDHFFDLGGHSLLATQVASRMRRTFGVEVAVRTVFERPRVAELARFAEDAGRAVGRPVDGPTRVDRAGAQPLSFAQQRLWFLDQLEPGSVAYTIAESALLAGALDVSCFERAVSEIARRHESLRTTFENRDGAAVARVAEPVPVRVPLVDLSTLDAECREAARVRLAAAEADTPFDLERGPLLRVTLLRFEAGAHEALVTMHHIVSDGWSMQVFVEELGALYQGFVAKRPASLPELPIQYGDYALWQRAWLEGGELDRQMQYWRAQLAEVEPLELPTDRPRPAVQTFRGASVRFDLGERLTARLKDLSRREGTTVYMTLLAGFQVLLSRYTGQEKIAVGSPVAARTRAETEGLIGFFVNTLVLRTDLSGEPTLRELLGRVRETALAAYAHQDVPFERLVEEIAPERDLSRSPLFQTMFVLQSGARVSLDLPDLRVELRESESRAAKFDLLLAMSEGERGLFGSLEFNSDLFDRSTAERMVRHFAILLESSVDAPDAPVARLSLLGPAERHELLYTLNETAAPFPEDALLHQYFERQAEASPSAVAVELDGREVTYRELNERADRVARVLLDQGLEPEGRVGICLNRSVEMIAAMLGVLKAGGAYVPLDPSYPADRVAAMLDDSRANTVLTTSDLAGALPPLGATPIALDRLDGEPQDRARPATRAAGGNLAYVIFTSGSTGRPKGVAIEHRSASAFVTWALGEFTRDELARVLFGTSICFDLSIFELFVPLACGGRVVLVENALALAGAGLASQVTLVNTVPSAMAELARGRHLPPGVRTVNLAGEALRRDLVDEVYAAASVERVLNLYGPSEDTTYSTYVVVGRDEAGTPSIGRPVANTRAYVLDGWMEPVPVGVAGELYLGGAGLARCYLGRPDLTAERFVPDPFVAGGRLYRTGDVVRRQADGSLSYLGRADQQVKVRGYRIEPGEVEGALVCHPHVEAAVVVADGSTASRRLIAYVVAKSGADLPEGEVRAFLRSRLPDFMVPSVVVPIERVPLTPNGKVDRKALPRPGAGAAVDGDSAAPRTEAERTIAAVWADVLGRECVGAHDNFFELGGDSIVSIQIVTRLAQAGIEVTPKELFQNQTVATLARVARNRVPASAALPATGPVPLTPIQRAFFDRAFANPNHYNQALLLDVRRRLDPALLDGVLGRLWDHHDALRARFAETAEGWVQEIAEPDSALRLGVVDLSGVPAAAQSIAAERVARSIQAGFDVRAGGLLRAVVVDFGSPFGTRLLLAAHHLVVDAVSWRVLVEDLEGGYDLASSGRPVAFGPKTAPLKAWVERLVAYQASEATAADISYWTSLAVDEESALPAELPGPNTTDSEVEALREFDGDLTGRLLVAGGGARRTRVHEMLLAALGRALGRRAGRDRVLVDVEGHGRAALGETIDVGRTVGWFTAVYPTLLDGGASDVAGSIKTSKEGVREAARRALAYEARGATPLRPRDVVFNYLGRVDAQQDRSSLFTLASGPLGELVGPAEPRAYSLEVTASILSGRLRVKWAYSSSLHRAETIVSLADAFEGELRAVLDACEQSAVLVPSDFPLSGLGQSEIDRLCASDPFVEDIYELSPTQQGFLFHSLLEPGGGAYVLQLRCRLEGELRLPEFRRAWEMLVDEAPVLRTYFVWEGVPHPVQVVRREASPSLEYEDWTGHDRREIEGMLEERIEGERRRGFDVGRAPVMRLALVRLSEREHVFLWGIHHLIQDGWSLSLLFSSFMRRYGALTRGLEPEPERARPYRDFVEWARHRDSRRSEAFWREQLRGATLPTPIAQRAAAGHSSGAPGEAKASLTSAETAALRRVAESARVTLFTVVHAAWAVVVGWRASSDDVVFGAVVAGRPADLPGVDEMLGAFINTVPVRARIPGERSVRAWLGELQRHYDEMREHEHAALRDIQGWCGIAPGTDPFESVVVFQNYPAPRAGAFDELGLAVADVHSVIRESYPLVLTVGPGSELFLRFGFDRDRFDGDAVARILDQTRLVLRAVAADPEAAVASLREALAEDDRRERRAREGAFASAGFETIRSARRRAVRRPE